MPRYIDADAFIKELEADIKEFGEPNISTQPIAYGSVLGIESVLSLAKELPTADVVPKSEVEKLQAEAENLRNANADLALALLYECEPTKEHLSELEKAVRVKVASEIFAEIEKIATAEGAYDYVSIQEIAELKKKYTEETK